MSDDDGLNERTIRIKYRKCYRAEAESPITGEPLVAYGDSSDEACKLVMVEVWREYDERGIYVERKDAA